MDRVVRIKKNGQTLVEIPETLYPVQVEVAVVDDKGNWFEKSYTWMLSYWRDESGLRKIVDSPKGTQIS